MAEGKGGFSGRGAAGIIMSASCIPCRNGVCAECEYPLQFASLNATAVDAMDFVNLREFCECYKGSREKHWELYEERLARAYDKAAQRSRPQDDRPRRPHNVGGTWEQDPSWEAVYRPFPALLKIREFDDIMTEIADVVHADDSPLGLEVVLAGHFDREIVFSASEPRSESFGEMGQSMVIGMEVFHDRVADLLVRLRLEGTLECKRVIGVLHLPEDSGDED